MDSADVRAQLLSPYNMFNRTQTRPMTRLALATLIAFAGLMDVAIGATSPPIEGDVDRVTKFFAEIQIRNYSKAAEFCADARQPEGEPISAAFNKYMAAFDAGTRAGLLEVSKTGSFAGQYDELFQGQNELLDQQSKQGAMILKSAEATPAIVCAKLANHFTSASQDAFRRFVIDSFREYREKRSAFCSKSPSPPNCD